MKRADVEFETRSFPNLLLYIDHSHGPVLAPATLAALPSTRAIPDRDVFYVADPINSIRPERFLRFCAGAHDRERLPIIVKCIHHNRLTIQGSERSAKKLCKLIYHKLLMMT